MGHIEDRWWKTIIEDGKKKRVKKARFGIGRRYRVRYIDPQGEEQSESFDDGAKEAAEDFRREVVRDVKRGGYIDPDAGRVFVPTYIEEHLANVVVDEQTLVNMERMFRKHITPFFRKLMIIEVKPSHIRKWVNSLSGVLEGSSQVTAFTYLKAMFAAAVDDEKLRKNPCIAKSVSPPKALVREIEPWTRSRISAMQKNLPDPYRDIVTVGAGCGLRIGEIFGLSPADVTEDGNQFHIQRQVKSVRNRLVFAPPKGGKTRKVPRPVFVRQRLEKRQTDTAVVKITLPWKTPDGPLETVELYFTTVMNRPIRYPVFMYRVWEPGLKTIGLTRGQDNGPHALRHHFASVLLENGVSIKSVSRYLGHADPGFTLRAYTHLMPQSNDRAQEAIDNLWTQSTPSRPKDGP